MKGICNLLSIIVPCYNEEQVITGTVRTLDSIGKSMVSEGILKDFELLFVDDGSTDKTLDVLLEYEKSPNVKIVSLSRNFGHQAALVAGLNYARGDAVVTIDADLQDPPDCIREMVLTMGEGCDVVFGVRRMREVDGFFKRLSASCFYKVMSWMGIDLVYNHADFRLMNRFIVNEFLKLTETNIFLRGLIPYLGGKRGYVYYDRRARAAGETKYPLRKMVSFAWDGITSFSHLPIRIATFIGLLISAAAFVGIIWALYLKVIGKSISGWTSMLMGTLLIGGVEILFLGLLGEYIGKIYREVKRRPLFTVKRVFNIDDLRKG